MDYILASTACFPFISPHEIDDKKFIDGGYFDNIPVAMALKRGAENVIAVDLSAAGIIKKDTLKESDSLKKISCKWSLGSFFAFNPENTKRIIRLGYLDAMKSFNVFSGEKYTFIKGEFAKSGLEEADAAAAVFGLDPTLIYSKEILDNHLREAANEDGTKDWKDELKIKVKKIMTNSPASLVEEEILAKRYIEKNKLLW